jgi:hypothetical protein
VNTAASRALVWWMNALSPEMEITIGHFTIPKRTEEIE